MRNREFEIGILHDRNGYATGCGRCQQASMMGYWVVEITIRGMHYVFGATIRTRCCSRIVRAVRPYGTREDAERRAQAIQEKLMRDDYTELCFIDSPFVAV